MRIYYLRIFIPLELQSNYLTAKAIAKLYYGLIGAIKMCGRKRLSYIRNNIVEVGKISRTDEIVLSFYYEDYCEYGLSYD